MCASPMSLHHILTYTEALIEDIQKDVEIAHNALASLPYDLYKNDF